MSARNLRRKLGNDSFDLNASQHDESSEDEQLFVSSKPAFNPFEMLDDDETENDQNETESAPSESIEPDLPSQESPQTKASEKKNASLKNSKKNASKLKNSQKSNQTKSKASKDEDLDDLLKQIPISNVHVASEDTDADHLKVVELLKVSQNLLDPDLEMKRLFGSGIVDKRNAARDNLFGPRGANRGGKPVKSLKKHLLVKPKPSWPPVGSDHDGLTMELKETKKGINYYKYNWSSEYKQAQKRFHACVESGDPNTLAGLLRQHPYHVDTLLQLHDAFEMTDDKDSSMDLIERLIYRFETSWNLRFDPLKDSSHCRLPYKYYENRSFLLGILSYIQEIGRKGCSQSALEWSKLLLSFDLTDPLGILFLIDHYALRRREHSYLIRFYHSDLFEEHDLTILPNFVYSTALACFYYKKNLNESEQSATSSSTDQNDSSDQKVKQDEFSKLNAEEMLHNAILMHPHLFVLLLSRLSVSSIRTNGVNVLEALPMFKESLKDLEQLNVEQNQCGSILNVLYNLYVERNHAMWKDPVCVQWLKDCTISLYKKLTGSQKSDLESIIASYRVLVSELVQGDNPTRITRHVMLCEFNSVIRLLPSEVLRAGFQIYSNEELQEIFPQQQQANHQNPGQNGPASSIARVLDYLVPWQTDPQQLERLLNLIGYRMQPPAAPQGNNNEEEED